jgi:hypothetical protein
VDHLGLLPLLGALGPTGPGFTGPTGPGFYWAYWPYWTWLLLGLLGLLLLLHTGLTGLTASLARLGAYWSHWLQAPARTTALADWLLGWRALVGWGTLTSAHAAHSGPFFFCCCQCLTRTRTHAPSGGGALPQWVHGGPLGPEPLARTKGQRPPPDQRTDRPDLTGSMSARGFMVSLLTRMPR